MNNQVHPQPISERIRNICKDAAYRLRVAESTGRKSAKRRGIYHYASDLVERIAEPDVTFTDHFPVEKDLLNGATDWFAYTWGGRGLTNDEDICRMFLSPSKQKAKKYGNLPPFKWGNWLDFEAHMAMKAKNIALSELYERWGRSDEPNSLHQYEPDETSTVQFLVVRTDFDAEWTNNIAGKLVTKNAYYVKGCILECHSWRPEGYVDCKPLDGSCSSMFLDHKTLSQYTASLY